MFSSHSLYFLHRTPWQGGGRGGARLRVHMKNERDKHFAYNHLPFNPKSIVQFSMIYTSLTPPNSHRRVWCKECALALLQSPEGNYFFSSTLPPQADKIKFQCPLVLPNRSTSVIFLRSNMGESPVMFLLFFCLSCWHVACLEFQGLYPRLLTPTGKLP